MVIKPFPRYQRSTTPYASGFVVLALSLLTCSLNWAMSTPHLCPKSKFISHPSSTFTINVNVNEPNLSPRRLSIVSARDFPGLFKKHNLFPQSPSFNLPTTNAPSTKWILHGHNLISYRREKHLFHLVALLINWTRRSTTCPWAPSARVIALIFNPTFGLQHLLPIRSRSISVGLS